MNRTCWTALPVLRTAAACLPALSAESTYETCDVTITGESRHRYVAGAISAECPPGFHALTGPWGNWGVRSNYGDMRDKDQFKGWYREGGKYLWDSCTTNQSRYSSGDPWFHNHSNHTAQYSGSVVQHRVKKIHVHVQECSSVDRPGSLDKELHGCSLENGSRITESNRMEIKELDWPDGGSAVDHLQVPSTSGTLSNCNENGCTGGTASWVSQPPSEVPAAIVEAQIRMRVSVPQENFCDLPE